MAAKPPHILCFYVTDVDFFVIFRGFFRYMICYVKMNCTMMARWSWKTLWYFKICCCHILKAPTATSERKLTIRPRLKSTQNMINLDLEIMNESSELFFKGSKDEKGCSKSFFLFPRIVVSRVSSSFVCLRAIRFLSHHWILRDLRYLAWLHFIFAY